jgi:hypothetical protein
MTPLLMYGLAGFCGLYEIYEASRRRCGWACVMLSLAAANLGGGTSPLNRSQHDSPAGRGGHRPLAEVEGRIVRGPPFTVLLLAQPPGHAASLRPANTEMRLDRADLIGTAEVAEYRSTTRGEYQINSSRVSCWTAQQPLPLAQCGMAFSKSVREALNPGRDL